MIAMWLYVIIENVEKLPFMEKNMLKNFKTNYKTGFYILISLGIIVLSLLYIMWINFSNDTELVIAQEGLIDLKELDGQETIELNGEWEFYPNLLLGPEDNFDEYSHLRKYVEVPGSWEPYLRNNSSVEGGGTYRLRIHLPRDGDTSWWSNKRWKC